MHGGGGGRGFSCAANGCRDGVKGEFGSMDSCKKVCRSWVRREGKCIEADGAPWDSYATKYRCEQATQQINDGTLNTI